MGTVSASAGPEEDRLKLVAHFKNKFPDLKFDDYIYSALAFDPDAKAQYNSIMEFPPYTSELDKGAKLWKTPLKSGKTYADCLPNGGKMIAGNYPIFDDAKGKVVTLEDTINDCRVANGEEAYQIGDDKTLGLISAYMRTLSDGMKMNIKVEGAGALKAYEDGKRTFYGRVGQLNFSCGNCHVDNAGVRIRSELLSPVIGQATHWPAFRGGDKLTTLQERYKGCQYDVRHTPDKPGSTRYNNLEYFHSYLSNGLEMKASVFRK
ncbi:MAG: sulfur oxidation c-type cytochrome SoxA [Pseudomonadota bacterium]|nr:sulfur oxidation c-type cytochrome SoxA [Pseudomonadota bacterium]MDP1903568.1 sulfur oxidation c-type cytochrome SoxA [Pseudomonadota bacterium]MDP2351437.1 sulfur oxidation c-type cytochrome SoxA [Pseudomonadota bacterium]